MDIPKNLIEQVKEQELNRLQETFGNVTSEENKSKMLAYSNLEVGDIILAKRYQTKEERKNIPAGHEIGPFVVAKVDEDSIQCFYASSKEDLLYREVCNTIALNLGYCLTKSKKEITTTYVDVSKTYPVSFKMFVRKTGQLSKKDLLKFKKVMEKYKSRIIEVSDIIIYDMKKYLVYQEEENYFKLNLLEKCSNHSQIQVNDEYYELSNSKIIIDKDEKVTFVGKCSSDVINMLNNEIKEGTIIEYYNHLYYVYSVDGNTLYCVFAQRVGKNNKIKTPGYNYVFINNRYYVLNWPTAIKLSKDDNYKVIEMSLNNENIIDRIKSRYKRNKQTLGKCPTPGKQWIVENKYTNELYLIIKTVGDNCYLIPYYDLIQGIKDNIIFDSKSNYIAKYVLAQKLYNESSNELQTKVKKLINESK